MENQKEIAEAEARKVMDWYYRESEKIAEKYKNVPGIDNGAEEQKHLTQQAHKKVLAIKRKYGID